MNYQFTILRGGAEHFLCTCKNTLRNFLVENKGEFIVDNKDVNDAMYFNDYEGKTYLFKGVVLDSKYCFSLLGLIAKPYYEVKDVIDSEISIVKSYNYDSIQLINIVSYMDKIINHSLA